MKNKYILLSVAVLCLFLLFVPMVYSSVSISPRRQLTFRTINVDGDPGEWDSIPPLVVDPKDDNGVDYEEEDIKAVFAANDEEFLYFLMELHEWDDVLRSTVNEGGHAEYRFYIDIIPSLGDPANNSADFYIEHWEGMVRVEQPMEDTEIFFWSDTGFWDKLISCGVQGEMMGRFIEVAVPWDCLECQECFNCFFKAHYEGEIHVNYSDFAPDQDAKYVMIGCCPGQPEPVGGEILPINILTMTLQWIAVCLAELALTLGIK